MPSRSTILAFLAFFAALAGTATAAKLINGKNIRPGTVTARQVKDRSLGTNELSRSAIASLRRRLVRVTGTEIVDGTVGLADLAPSSVGSTQVVDRSIGAGDVGADTLTQTELGVGSVGDTELADNAVGNGEIKGNAISRNQLRPSVLRAGTVTTPAFGAIADGDCETQTVPGADAQIPAGALTDTVIEVEPPATLAAGFIIDARSVDGTDLQVQVCNVDAPADALGALRLPFVALAG